MRFDDGSRDVQAKAETAGMCACGLLEPIENALEIVGGDPAAVVGHVNPAGVNLRNGTERNRSARRSELQGISQQVREHLYDPVVIERGFDRFGWRFQPQLDLVAAREFIELG